VKCIEYRFKQESLLITGIKDMIPLPTDEGFEGFEALTERTNSWLKEQPLGTVLINMQSVMVQKQEGKYSA
jgi:hypothetical protein